MADMWYDDFDAELYKVVPEAERLIAPLAHVEMRTTGHPDRQTGRLNHPTVWNGHHGMVAFFGCRLQAQRFWKPEHYYTSSPVIECTFEEMIRDTWVHECLVIVDGGGVLWNSWKLRDASMGLMYHVRGWPNGGADEAAGYRKRVLREVDRACRKLSALIERQETVG